MVKKNHAIVAEGLVHMGADFRIRGIVITREYIFNDKEIIAQEKDFTAPGKYYSLHTKNYCLSLNRHPIKLKSLPNSII